MLPTSSRTSLNQIAYGANKVQLPLAGSSIAQIEEALYEVLNLPSIVLCYVNGRLVWDKENFVLEVGMDCFFWRGFGCKGSGVDENNYSKRQILALESIAMRLEEISVNLIAAIESNTAAMARVADHFNPSKRTSVTSSYVAQRLGRTGRWIGELARNGQIPKSCICPGSGDGKYWRFWKDKIDQWIETQTLK